MCDEEQDEDEEHHTVLNDNKSNKMSNGKESSDGVTCNKNHKCKENEIFKLIKKLKGEVKKAGMAQDMLERKSVYVEECYET